MQDPPAVHASVPAAPPVYQHHDDSEWTRMELQHGPGAALAQLRVSKATKTSHVTK
jgi:hypothetical protein